MDLFNDYTLRSIALGAGLLGLVSGILGTFAVLRRQALLGDAISHAALPGIVLAFMLTGSRAALVLVIGAALAGWLGTLIISLLAQHTRLKSDSVFGLVLAVFFAIGMILLTNLQHSGRAGQAGLSHLLFGQAAAIVTGDLLVIGSLGGFVLLVVALGWKEFKLLSFDAGYAQSLGYRVRLLDGLLTALIVIAIVIGLQLVGVVLMSAMLVAPAAAARQWTNRLGTMALLAGGFGAAAGVLGAVLSVTTTDLATGPLIVVIISALVFVSLLFAPERGLVMRSLHRRGSTPRP